ncbi:MULTISPECIES: folate-binding protein YgfZ [unclassified Acidovorax]|uniref:CAF17-like 4Fe-4S cluster assembly/insertion protein YgfZ n=1 Tax=unclassified Acidovorax TaxID=2684926 RepID=UPI001C48B646|nr:MULTISPECIES: folate-binding protein [unclassified Acidovorax]MBV7460153.1 folate-binding protein [Acidovorax sp. sif0632]MBV7465178.1 folate-binding protein [Acidovorax sp. sif0613]
MTYPLNGITPLSHLGVIRVEGEDAAKFLHGQLTQDFALLGMDQARLAAFLSAKGRMQASFIGFKRSATEVLLVCSRDLLPPTLKRLSMFVLRAKAKLTDATNDFALYGLAGDTVPDGSQPAWTKADIGTASVVHLYPADGQPRALWVAPAVDPAPAGPALDAALWLWSEVKSGVATLTTPVVEAFVPQMLNYESLGGVNFKKGCYPGQEVVARSQFRGTLKRRAYIAHAPAEVAVGAEVFNTADLEQPCGTVVQVASAPGGGFDTIVSLQISAAQEGSLQVGATDGVALALLPLPYALLKDI